MDIENEGGDVDVTFLLVLLVVDTIDVCESICQFVINRKALALRPAGRIFGSLEKWSDIFPRKILNSVNSGV